MISSMNRVLIAAACLAGGLLPNTSGAAVIGVLEQLQPSFIAYTHGVDFLASSTTPVAGFGQAQGSLQAVDIGSGNSGCDTDDFAGFTTGSIALIERGICTFSQKINNATVAGAIGVLIFNHDLFNPGLVDMGAISSITLPSLFLTRDLGLDLVAALGGNAVEMRIEVSSVPEPAILGLLSLGLLGLALSRRGSLLSSYAKRPPLSL